MAAGYFLLLAQKKVTKENGTLGSAPLAKRAVRCGRTGSADRPSMACSRIGAIPRAARVRCTRLFRSPSAAAQRGPESKSIGKMDSGLRRNDGLGVRRIYAASPINGVVICGGTSRRFCGRDCRVLLYPGPSRPRRAGAGNCREAVAGRMPASSTRVQGRAPGEPGACSRSHAGMDARVTATPRVSFLWLLSFGQAKESNWSPWMATKPHTDVSRFSRKPKPIPTTHPTLETENHNNKTKTPSTSP